MKSTFAQRLATLPPLTMQSPSVTRAIADWDQLKAAVNDPGFLDRLQAVVEEDAPTPDAPARCPDCGCLLVSHFDPDQGHFFWCRECGYIAPCISDIIPVPLSPMPMRGDFVGDCAKQMEDEAVTEQAEDDAADLAEKRDWLIVLPVRLGADEDAERFDADFEGQRN